MNKHHIIDQFKGILTPVFTCFKGDEAGTLELDFILTYATHLKKQNIAGVMVNSITGEGPALGVKERKITAEVWCEACQKVGIPMLLQIGGAPLPDVLDLAEHANTLDISGVVVLPELFYKPRTIEQLMGYCRIVSRKARNIPFFYYHIPRFTGVHFDMAEFCRKASDTIPTFLGLIYDSFDLDMGSRCLSPERVIFIGDGKLLASAMMLGFESAILSSANMVPELAWSIYDLMNSSNLTLAKQKQKQLNNLIRFHTNQTSIESWVGAMKTWFNEEMEGFTAGPSRRFF